jgi:metallo-beta-lactamase class B
MGLTVNSQRRKPWRSILCALATLMTLATVGAQSRFTPDPPKRCDSCPAWNERRAPFLIVNNTYYVGVAGLSSLLVTSPQGHVLVDGGLPQSAAIIDENIRTLGFRIEDVRLILVSHEHYDHVGGVAALQRASGAVVAASPAAAKALRTGGPLREDPQYEIGVRENAFAPVKNVREIADGETLRVGDVAVTAHFTPGHTPGSTSWSWRSCAGGDCKNFVYADSLTAVSAPAYRFSDHAGAFDRFRTSMATIASLPCDVIVSTHPDFTELWTKLRRREAGSGQNPFVEADGCKAYADAARAGLEKRIASERAGKR